MSRATLTILASLALLAACAGGSARVILPAPNAADRAQADSSPRPTRAPSPSNQGFAQLRAQDQRVADIAYRLAKSSAELCPDTAPLLGLTLHTRSQYSQRMIEGELAGRFPGDRPAILVVAAGGPAALAGLRADDLLLAVDGKPLPTSRSAREPSYADTQSALDTLTSALAPGRTSRLTVQRDGQNQEIVVTPEEGCAYDAELTPSSAMEPLFGWARRPPGSSSGSGHVLVSEAMADYARDDDELAVVMGHEYAHALLHHPAGAGVEREAEADYVGLYLAARAGYDIDKAVPFWAALTRDYPSEPFSHGGPARRIAALSAARREIEARRAASQPLIPNFTADQARPPG